MSIHETTITELLNSFFNEEPRYIKEEIVNFLVNRNGKSFSYEDFNTFTDQGKYTDNQTKLSPDIVFEGEDSLVFIEIKINNTTLEPSQKSNDENEPNTYVGMLKKSGKKNTALFFLVPSDYAYKNDIPNQNNIITWKELGEFVQEKEFDNQILRRIIYLTADFDFSHKYNEASVIDMQYLTYDTDCLSRILRIHKRLRKILNNSNCETKYFNGVENISEYCHDPNEKNPYNNKSCIVEGKHVNEDSFGLVVFEGMPYIYLDTSRKLTGCENLTPKLNNGTNLYKICVLDTTINDAVNKLNEILQEGEK